MCDVQIVTVRTKWGLLETQVGTAWIWVRKDYFCSLQQGKKRNRHWLGLCHVYYVLQKLMETLQCLVTVAPFSYRVHRDGDGPEILTRKKNFLPSSFLIFKRMPLSLAFFPSWFVYLTFWHRIFFCSPASLAHGSTAMPNLIFFKLMT